MMDNNNSAFMTHHGLKVRLNHDFCTENIAEQKIIPWYISIEAFDSLRVVLAVISTVLLMFFHKHGFLYSCSIITISYLYGYYISQSYFEMALLNLIYGFFYMIYSFLDRLFIPYIALVIISVITKEYGILMSFVFSRVICFLILSIVNIIRAKHYMKKYGVYLGDVEITAAKLIQFYSDNDLKFNQWLKEYSEFMNSENMVINSNE